jgi:hypothetical protein
MLFFLQFGLAYPDRWMGGVLLGVLILLAYLMASHWSRWRR